MSVTVSRRVVSLPVVPTSRPVAVADAVRRVMHGADKYGVVDGLDLSDVAPQIIAAKALLAGRIEYAARCRAAADHLRRTGAGDAARWQDDFAAESESRAVHLLSGCYARCCGFDPASRSTACVVTA